VAVSPNGNTVFVTGACAGITVDYATVAYNGAASRAWASGQGILVSAHGCIPEELVEQDKTATGGADAAWVVARPGGLVVVRA